MITNTNKKAERRKGETRMRRGEALRKKAEEGDSRMCSGGVKGGEGDRWDAVARMR